MSRPTILVTGATGKTGAAVAAQLRQLDWPVRAVVRARDARSAVLDRLGAQTVVADLSDPEQVLAALRGTDRVYYVPVLSPHLDQAAAAFAAAAREARPEAVVQMSQWLSSPDHPALMTRQTWMVDQLFSTLPGVGHTILNPGYFADNDLRLIDFSAQLGLFPNLVGDSLNAPPSNEDMARAAVAVLSDPAPHAGRTYRPTGPALLSAGDMARTLGRVLNRPVRRVDLPWALFERAARLQGVAPYDVAMLRHYVEDHRQGAFALNAPNDHLLTLTGRPAESFEATARRYAALPKARRTPANFWRTLIDFARTPLSPGYQLNRYEREQGFPVPQQAQDAMHSPVWLAGHRPAGPRAVPTLTLDVA